MLCLALGTTGEDVRCLIARRHQFNYPQQGEVFKDPETINAAIEWADWVWIIQTELPNIMGGSPGHWSPHRQAWLDLMKPKRVAILNGGGYYRDNRDFYKQLWSPFNPLSICYEADLMGTFENEHLVIPPVNLEWFKVKPRIWGTLRIGHFPSRPTDKGSEWIVPMMRGTTDVDFLTSVHNPFSEEDGSYRLPWLEHLERMSNCDVIIDQIKPELKGKPFGEWVSIATEAAALGKISIANSLDQNPYHKTYGRFPGIHVCNTPEELIKEVERIKTLPDYELEREKTLSRKWVEDFHTLEPTGRILLKLCQAS